MTYLLLCALLLTGCTIKVALPTDPIPIHHAMLLSGEDPVNNVMRVSVAEAPIEPSVMQRTIDQVCKPQRERNDTLKMTNANLYESLILSHGVNLELYDRIAELDHALAIARNER